MSGIIVNSQGKRFANLHGWAKEVMPVLLKQEQATLWFIFDEASRPKFVVSGSDWADFKHVERLILKNPRLVKSADTLDELARTTGLPNRNLIDTIRRYNRLVEQGADQDFGRFGPQGTSFSKQASPKIETPPFYAMQSFPLTRKSMGGVAIDLSCRVLDKKQQPIPGLYAVGELTGLAGINGKAALEGTFLGPCIVTGRVAARSLLKELAVAERESTRDVDSCTSCHDMKSLLAEPRPGYWHFEKVHGAALVRQSACRQCHPELAPYQIDSHHVDRQTLAAT
ncbi:MAG: FAD-binding protein, partial [Planctomycetes bacterium]|nr:FAD-binding protein [Planctomycetota bacterium]